MVTYKPLVFLAVLSTATILACKDDPSGLGGTGSLVLIVVPYEEAQPAAAASPASDAESSTETRPSTATNRGTARPSEQTSDETRDLNVGPEKEEAKAARQTAAAPPRRDLLRVNLSGPDTRSLDFTPNADGSVDVTITSLPEGTYSVELLGLDTDLGPELVSEYGVNNSVTVRSDQTTNAVISFGSFLPVIDPTLPAQTSEFAFVVDYTAIPSATGYFFELDTDPSFPGPTTLSTTGTSVIISVDALGPNWMRVRAENNNVPAAQAKPSDPVLVDVVADLGGPTGDDAATAMFLGTVNTATGQYTGFNIYPATDEDWFALDLSTDATLSVEVLSVSLSQPALTIASPEGAASPSNLDPVLGIFDPGLNLIASNDDDVTLEPRLIDVPISTDGTHYIRVTSFATSVGHYELVVTVNAPAVARVDVTPPTATIVPSGQVQLTGQTFDQMGVELFGREAIWSSSDNATATVDGTGLVTGQSFLGTATITMESEGIQGTATIDVTNIPAAKVVITPTSGLLQGIGQTVQWSAEAFDASDNVIPGKPINWWGANPAVADADGGLVEAFGNGQTIIVAEADGVEGYALITVTDPVASVVNYWSDGPPMPSGSEDLLGVWGASSSAVYTVGANGTILFNDGNGWSGVGAATMASFSGVWGADDREAWAVGSGGTLGIVSGGASWNAEVSPTTEQLRGVWGAAFDDVYAVGGSPGVAAMVHRDGATWTVVAGLPVTNPLNAVYGFASDEVFVVADNGAIIRFDGTSWSTMNNATVESLFAVWGTSPSDVYAVGASGRIVHYDGNVGQNWVSVASGTTESLLAVWGTNANDVLAAGTNGAVVHYDGTTWSPQISGTTNALRAIWGSPNPGVTAVGDLGTVRLGSRGASVIVSPDPVTIDVLNGTQQMTAEVQDAVGTVLASGNVFTWMSSDDLIASVDVNGLVTGNATGTVTITATSQGLSGTADVTYDPASPTMSLITAAPAALIPDGISTSTITVQVKDGDGTDLTTGGDAVVLATTAGSLSGVVDNANGSYTATLTSATTPGLATITGTLNGRAMTDDEVVTFTDADPAQSTIMGAPTSIPADGASTSVITVQLVDASGTPLTGGGDLVELLTDLGTLSAVTDLSNGTYTATVTAGTTPGFATISGTVWGQAMSDAIVTFRSTAPAQLLGTAHEAPGAGSGTGGPAALYSLDPASGAGTPIGMIGFHRVGAIDRHPSTGVLYAAAQRSSDGIPVIITIDPVTGVGTEIGPTGVDGSVTDIAFHSNGTLYLFEGPQGGRRVHTVNLTTGAATLLGGTGFSGGGLGMWFNGTNTLFLTWTSGPTTNLSTVSTSTGVPTLLGAFTITGAPCPDHVINAVDRDPVSGVFYASITCEFTAPRVKGLGVIDVTTRTLTVVGNSVTGLDGIVSPFADTPPTTGPASELFTTVGTFNNNIAGDGVDAANLIIIARDATDTQVLVGGDHVALSTTLGTLSAVTDNGDGTYTATLTSTTAGTATITGTLNGVAIISTQDIIFVASSPQWIQLAPTGAPPMGRSNASAVIDETTNQMITFGGKAGLTSLNDLWSLSDANGVGSPSWNPVSPVGAPPRDGGFMKRSTMPRTIE